VRPDGRSTRCKRLEVGTVTASHAARPAVERRGRAGERLAEPSVIRTASPLAPPSLFTVRGADLLHDVARLRDQPGGDIYVYGSLSVVRALLAAGLVDELVLMIQPITLGGGKTLFPTDGEARAFELISATTTGTGVQICRYQPAR
jgi:dihydrofolate reductase